ncbi:hypothetical protein AAXE64_27850 [Priestia megaterium]|uniref:hypothetical protein n=1 Tax=Priestia megaterium TaxID=1404 RepID=UPI003CFC0BC7
MSYYAELCYEVNRSPQVNVIFCEQEGDFMQEIYHQLSECFQEKTFRFKRLNIFKDNKLIKYFKNADGDVVDLFERWIAGSVRHSVKDLAALFEQRQIKYTVSRNGFEFQSKKEKRRGIKLAKKVGLSYVLEGIN